MLGLILCFYSLLTGNKCAFLELIQPLLGHWHAIELIFFEFQDL